MDQFGQELAEYRSMSLEWRVAFWRRVRELSATRSFTQDVFRQLVKLAVEDARTSDIWTEAMTALLSIVPGVPRGPMPVAASANGAALLGEWLWTPFSKSSIVLGLYDPHYRRRDEGAMIMLGRHLSFLEFAHTRFQFVRLKDPHWELILSPETPTSLCFVGRLGLFGEEALHRWGKPQGRRLRFRFNVQQRPKFRFRRGTINRRYHCILEDIPSQKEPLEHVTVQRGTRRTDYALVQRYTVVTDAGRICFVFCVAGATWVGTEGACRWAAAILPYPREAQDCITLPKDVGPKGQLEALLRVSTDLNAPSGTLPDIELCSLFVDDWAWDQESRTWRPPTVDEIVILCTGGDPRQPVALEVTGKRHRFQKRTRTPRLVAALFSVTGGKSGTVIDLKKIADEMRASDGAPSIEQVRKWLKWFKVHHNIQAAISLGDPPRLLANLRIRSAEEPS